MTHPQIPTLQAATGLREALVALRSARNLLQGADLRQPGALAELATAEEELATQLLEVETAALAAQEGRSLTRRLLQALPVAMLTTTGEGAVLESNAAAQTLLQVPAQALERHKPLFAYVDPADRRAARDLLGAVAGAEFRTGSLTLTPRTGEAIRCKVMLTRWPEGQRPTGGGPSDEPVQWVFQAEGEDSSAATVRYRSILMELSRLGVTEADLTDLLRRVADLACRAVLGAQEASIVLADPHTVASTSPLAQATSTASAGPLVEAFTSGAPVLTAAPAGNHGAFAPQAGDCLALPLVLETKPVGAMVLYGAPGYSFSKFTIEEAAPFAAAAETLVRDSRTMQEIRLVQDQLREALSSRAVIDQAKGMVMLARGCSPDEAFAVLVKMSNDSNRKIRDLAAELVADASQGRPAVP